MSNTLKNLLVLLGVLTVGYAGYYLYTARSATTLDLQSTDVEFQAMLTRTQAFIQRSQELNSFQLDLGLFEDATFRNLESNEVPLEDVAPGRPNPFAETIATDN